MLRYFFPALLLLLACPSCGGRDEPGGRTAAEKAGPPTPPPTPAEQLLKLYDTERLTVPRDQFLAGARKDSIPALTDPPRLPLAEAKYPRDDGRLAVVQLGEEAVAYPLGILNWHEIVNDTVAGVPLAVTYCPLCDSVAVFRRTLASDDDQTQTLEFGVSGLLLNSNVVMYERTTKGLWTQVGLRSLSGAYAGRSLPSLPVRMLTMRELRQQHPDAEVLSIKTGHDRDYFHNPYRDHWETGPVFFGGRRFKIESTVPAKTLGLGVVAGGKSFFVTRDRALESPVTLETPAGPLTVSAGEAGLSLASPPPGADVMSVQTFFYSWSAFHPGSQVEALEKELEAGAGQAADSGALLGDQQLLESPVD